MKILTDHILSTERLWKELLQLNDQFFFSAPSPGSYFRPILDSCRYFKGLEGKYEFDLHFILQEKGCKAGDWFGNRSISAEVNLKAGIYKVLAKIEAPHNADAPEVQDVAVKFVETNPRKLREISYDIAKEEARAEAKGGYQKKKKQIEEEAREMEESEAWKKEEKVSTKLGRERRSNKGAKGEQDQALAPGHTDKIEHDASSPTTVHEERPGVKAKVTEDDAIEARSKPETKTNVASDDEQETQDATENLLLPKVEGQTAPPSTVDSPGPSRPMYGQPHGVYGDAPPPPQQQQSPPARLDNTSGPWNAVCVLGLRIYSQDPEISIQLIKPKDVEEGAILDVDGDTPAGATM
ncbi:hypothetical protein SNOG_13284 [Parastagonospora nodorum SN15]|uniref:Uncharacterized protein n=1 Tax=Phaeosphaeria nodorum (strain SN15 / ATCC MYA-4574 / FGSC 10173) TaxID=321614 RepID=Q0U4N0_PHANO|nr:hypothetical protein SNOG_13284 [Parastagonospora nodorum SN15]EAT79168.2 hypothetical protein SNOG_13284 [Parastagonospora nodorum SN15]